MKVVLGVGSLLAVTVVAVVQVLNLGELMDEAMPYNAARAEGLVAAYALAVVTIAVRAAGVSYVIGDPSVGGLRGFPYLRRMVRAYGRPVATVPGATIYELPSKPR